MSELARTLAQAMWAEDRASSGLGMRLDAVAPGHARLSMTITETMANGHGICHGGFIFALADFGDGVRGQSARRGGGGAARVDHVCPSGERWRGAGG